MQRVGGLPYPKRKPKPSRSGVCQRSKDFSGNAGFSQDLSWNRAWDGCRAMALSVTDILVGRAEPLESFQRDMVEISLVF